VSSPLPIAAATLVLSLAVSACTSTTEALDDVVTSSVRPAAYSGSSKERDCLARAMFFESRRSSREGLVAVGTVVMNRVKAPEYPDTICGVVGQKNQFAPGVLSRPMKSKALPDVMAAADAVLKGERHPKIGNAKFFHTAGLKFPYKNMHYVHVAGGNAFYEKRSRARRAAEPVRQQTEIASAVPLPQSKPVVQVADTDGVADPDTGVLAFDAE
jgi:spore germination cell wall hydrolase CwlJ-like protein